jgi:hypothetical protein
MMALFISATGFLINITEQMLQAGRSGKQNIVEASMESVIQFMQIDSAPEIDEMLPKSHVV